MARKSLSPAEIGSTIRTVRKACGLRQDELAGVAGVGVRFLPEYPYVR